MNKYNFIDLRRDEQIACNVLAIYTLFNSANSRITVQDIENEIDIICNVYKKEKLIEIANLKLSKLKKYKTEWENKFRGDSNK